MRCMRCMRCMNILIMNCSNVSAPCAGFLFASALCAAFTASAIMAVVYTLVYLEYIYVRVKHDLPVTCDTSPSLWGICRVRLEMCRSSCYIFCSFFVFVFIVFIMSCRGRYFIVDVLRCPYRCPYRSCFRFRHPLVLY